MTTLVEAQAEIIEAQGKLIKQQAIEIMELEHKLEQREYNRRFTNVKHLKPMPKFDATLLDPKKLIAGIDPTDRFHKEVKRTKTKSLLKTQQWLIFCWRLRRNYEKMSKVWNTNAVP